MSNPTDQNFEHHTQEIKSLFKHLLVFLIVIFVLRLWNSVMFPTVNWSSVILIIWTIFLVFHLLLFFLSTGVLGQDYENVPVKLIANRLISAVKERNVTFKQSFTKKKQPITNNPTP